MYVLENMEYNKLFVGLTGNIEKRLEEHNRGYTVSTKPYKPWKIIHFEAYVNKDDATRREKYLKTGQGSWLLKRMLKEYMYAKNNKIK